MEKIKQYLGFPAMAQDKSMEESVSESRRVVTKEYAATTYPGMFQYES